MKVLFLPKWYPNKNDVQHGIFIKNQVKALSKFQPTGVLFVVTTSLVDDVTFEIEKEENYFALTAYFPKKSNRLAALYSYYKTFGLAKTKMEQEWGKPDVITLYILGRNYMMYKKFYSGIPFIVSEQWSGYLNGGMERYIYAKRRNTLNALKKAQQLVAVSLPLANALKKYSGGREVQVIPNIVFHEPVTENKIRDMIQILTVADLDDEIKNISGMLDALQKVSVSTAVSFTIIGEGKDEVALKARAKQLQHQNFEVRFKKRMPHNELLKEYRQSNFYLLNSHFETFCVAAAESVASGRPVVATRCGGPEAYLNDSNAIFSEKNNSMDLANAIEKMVGKMRQNAFQPEAVSKTVDEKYGADTIAKQYITVLDAAINKKK